MSQYQTLKAQVSANIKQNDNQEIRGDILQAQLLAMINSLGVGYQYMGLATPATNPGTPDQNVFFLATEAGTYTNFNSLVVNDGEVCALVWNGAWAKQVTGAATAAEVSQLGQKDTELNRKLFAIIGLYSIQQTTWYGAQNRHIVIPVNGGENVVFTKNGSALYFAFLTDYTFPVEGETPAFVSGYVGRQGSVTPFTIPVGTKYLVINNPVKSGEEVTSILIDGAEMLNGIWGGLYDVAKKNKTLSASVASIETILPTAIKESDLGFEVISQNIADPVNITNGSSIDSSGRILTNPSYVDKYQIQTIPVTPGQKITFGGFDLGRSGYCAFYNDDTLVSYYQFSQDEGISGYTVTVPSGANLLHFNIQMNGVPSSLVVMANYGATLLPYVPFEKGIETIKGYKLAFDDVPEDIEERLDAIEETLDGLDNRIMLDLPLSADGSGIEQGYGYINSTTGVVTIKL